MDCRVVLEAAVPVYDVSSAEEAIRIAIAKTGELLNPDLSHVEIEPGDRTSPSGEFLEPAFVVADEALVALELEMTVFSVDRPEHAKRVARKEIGQQLENVPLSVRTVEDVTDEPDESAGAADVTDEADGASDESGDRSGEHGGAIGDDGDDSQNDEQPPGEKADDDVLPEFEELL